MIQGREIMTSALLKGAFCASLVFIAQGLTGAVHAQDGFPRFSCDLSDVPIPLDASQEVTITLTPTERELLNLAIPGYIDAVEAEFEGTVGLFPDRAFGLGVFAYTTVPCIRDKINDGLTATDSGTFTFNSFERVAIQIMTSIWNSKNGVMSHHIAGCRISRELREDSAILCQTFFPLAEAADNLFKKVSKDEPDGYRKRR